MDRSYLKFMHVYSEITSRRDRFRDVKPSRRQIVVKLRRKNHPVDIPLPKSLFQKRTRNPSVHEWRTRTKRGRNDLQCDVNYFDIRRATVWSYEFHRRKDGRVPPAEGTGPYEKLPIPTDLEIVHITLLVGGQELPEPPPPIPWEATLYSLLGRAGRRSDQEECF